MKAELIQGQQYEGTFKLSGLQLLGSNNDVAIKLIELGFSDVSVNGNGSYRFARGVWKRSTQVIDLPEQVKEFKKAKAIKSL
ncbi:MAG: hypothetical protein AAB638_00695 [Patescibacteria group bacterium]